MAADREDYPGNDFLEYGDLSELWASLDHADSVAARPQGGNRQTTCRQSVKTEPADEQYRWSDEEGPEEETYRQNTETKPAGETRRRNVEAKPAGETRRRSAEAKPAGKSQTVRIRKVSARKSAKRRLTPRERRFRRRVKLLAALLAVVGVVYVASNVIVFRVKDFQAAPLSADQQVLSWKKARGVDGYDIYDGSGTLLAQLGADQDPQYAVAGLTGGTQYTYSIVAVKDFIWRHTGKAVQCSAYTMPDTVSALSAINSGTGVILSWDDSAASGYEVQYTDGYSEPKTLQAQKSDAGGLSIPDLQEGAQYTFQVRSFVQDGQSRVYSEWNAAEPITAVRTADMTGIDVTKPMVALTFDDGPDYGDVTDRILATLSEYGAHASFFQEGGSASNLPELMGRIASAGHEIACHTYDHSHYGSDVTAEDIISADDAIEQACGKRPSAFRSPGGMTTDLIRDICISEGMPIFYWSIDTEDWKSRDADAVCDVVMDYVSDGDIILMHNVYDSTADAVERIVPFLAEKGYQMVTVSQLVQAKTGKPPVPGTQYVTATETN